MNLDQIQRRSSSTPLFRAIPTGTYIKRYADADINARAEAGPENVTQISEVEAEDKDMETMSDIKAEPEPEHPVNNTLPPASTIWQPKIANEPLFSHPIDFSDPILYRETIAVENGSMALLSKQIAVESPLTGAKGRARQREAEKFSPTRMMPSQSLVDVAKALNLSSNSFPSPGRAVSYPRLTRDGYLATGMTARRPDEMLLVGCGRQFERRSREGGEEGVFEVEWVPRIRPSRELVDAAVASCQPLVTKGGFLPDGKAVSDPGGVGFMTPEAERVTLYGGDGNERVRERSRLRDESARLLEEFLRLNEVVKRREEEETLEEENLSLRSDIERLRASSGSDVAGQMLALPNDVPQGEELWKNDGMGNQPRRPADRGNRVGASPMSQEVVVEHPAAGKGRAREREEKRRLQNLAHEPSRSDTDADQQRSGRRRIDWPSRELTDSGDDEAREVHHNDMVAVDGGGAEEEWRGRMKARDEAATAALASLPDDVCAKYGPDQPPRVWREHSHEILVERKDGGGTKGRRRDANLKHAEGATPRYMPSQGMMDAAASSNHGRDP